MNKLQNYVKLCEARIQNALLAKTTDVMPEAEKFPCECCCGEGLLLKKSVFASLKYPTQKLKNALNDAVVCTEAITCKECGGTGVNEVALFAYAERVVSRQGGAA